MKIRVERIICATDFSDYSNHAVSYGLALAREFGARLYVCHVIDLPAATVYGETMIDPGALRSRIIDFALGEIGAMVGAEETEWEPVVTIGHAADEIARLSREFEADLVITATRSRSGLTRLILGSVTQKLLQLLSIPLLIIQAPGPEWGPGTERTIGLKRIMVGCDFSPNSQLAFEYGTSLALQFQAELHLVHVIPPAVFEDMLKPGEQPGDEYKKNLRERLTERLKAMIPAEAEYWCESKATLLAGEPHEELVKYATVNDIGLIVLGVRGRGLMETLLVGSTTDRVLRRTTCPVLAVSPALKPED